MKTIMKISSFFTKIKWKEYFILLMWRILFILSSPLIIVLFLPAIIINAIIWFITGKGYFDEIGDVINWYGDVVYEKLFD